MNGERIRGFVRMMMAPPQVVGVLLKKPGQHSDPRVPPIDPQETKIRGELYVEDLSERRIVSIRMGWLWVEGTQMKLPLRALNLRQATTGICQPHVLALGFTLSNSQGDLLATFWADTEPIYWSWVRAIAAELVRQTPFRAQRCLNFLEILTICPRGPVPLPDSPTETRRRSRSELRCWLGDSPTSNKSHRIGSVLEDSRRRARSELRGWSSSNSSDDDLHLTEFCGIQTAILPKIETTLNGRAWGCSESSEGSDDSLPWGAGCRSSVDSIDSAPAIPEADTREQRIQRYKEARRRENEARSRRVLEEDALRRKARLEENNNNNNTMNHCNNNNNEITSSKSSDICRITCQEARSIDSEGKKSENNQNNEIRRSAKSPSIRTPQEAESTPKSSEISKRTSKNREKEKIPGSNRNGETKSTRSEKSAKTTDNCSANALERLSTAKDSRGDEELSSNEFPKIRTTDPLVKAAEPVDAITRRLPPLKVPPISRSPIVRFRESNVNNRHDARNNNNDGDGNRENGTRSKPESPPSPGVVRTDSGERRSRARERRNVRERCQAAGQTIGCETSKTTMLQERKERLTASSRIPIASRETLRINSNSRITGNGETIDMEKKSVNGDKERRERGAISLPRTTMTSLPILECCETTQCETEVAILLARCQRVDHYVPVREKLTLFESLSRMGGRLARSTEDLGRSSLSKTSPRGKQRARSLHDLNRAARSLPVREMCRLFEGDRDDCAIAAPACNTNHGKIVDNLPISPKKEPASILKNNTNRNAPPCVRTSTRRKHYQK